MDQFQDHQYVWLRNQEHGTYLYAHKDGHGVSLRSRRRSMKAAWVVQRLHGDDRQMLLRSAAYGRYLSGTVTLAAPGCPGFRVAQRNYDDLEEEAIRWEAYRFGHGNYIWLRRTYNGGNYGYLRGNGMHNFLNAKEVSVVNFDIPNISTLMGWEVQPIPTRERIPHLPRPPRFHISLLDTSRVVIYTGNLNGQVFDIGPFGFRFKGRSVFNLRKKLAIHLGINENNCDNLVLYVGAGIYGDFTPLVVNLPNNRQTLLIAADTSDDEGPLYPDFEQV